jgi:hypothetical protein
MRRALSVIAVFLCVLLVSACAKTPSQESFPYKYQKKMQSADHWNYVAGKVAGEQISPFFLGKNSTKPEQILAVYVADKDQSSFGKAFQTYMTTYLFDMGIPVAKTSENAVTLDWSVQKIVHEGKRRNPGPPCGVFGYLAYGISWLFGGDYYVNGRVPQTELLLVTKLSYGNIVYSRVNRTMFINDDDTANYWVLPDRSDIYAHTYVREGAIVCREVEDLGAAAAGTQLPELVKEGKCAVMANDFPITIVEDKSAYVIIKSLEEPYKVYVTQRESVGD